MWKRLAHVTILIAIGASATLVNASFVDLEPRAPGNPIPDFDDFILCFAAVPPSNAQWPPGRVPETYVSNQKLCPATSSIENNVGCRCDRQYGEVSCTEPPADPVLWHAILSSGGASGWRDFKSWCIYHCWCATEDLTDLWKTYTPEEQAGAEEDEVQNYLGAITAGSTANLLTGPSLASLNATNPRMESMTGRAGAASFADKAPTYSPQCNASGCEVTSQCPGADCQCRVTGARYEPQAGSIEYIAGCAVYIASGMKMRREEEMPCPCNRSYVSYACCEIDADGWVWEGAELKLGELVKSGP